MCRGGVSWAIKKEEAAQKKNMATASEARDTVDFRALGLSQNRTKGETQCHLYRGSFKEKPKRPEPQVRESQERALFLVKKKKGTLPRETPVLTAWEKISCAHCQQRRGEAELVAGILNPAATTLPTHSPIPSIYLASTHLQSPSTPPTLLCTHPQLPTNPLSHIHLT